MAEKAFFHVAVVGGGAVGLAVLLRLVEKGSRGMKIAVFEKESTIGPGLAYSEACAGTRINMHSRLMSMYVSDQDHFDRWMKANPSSSAGEQFPPRPHYGKYLQTILESVLQSATDKGIEVSTYTNSEVSDMEQTASGWKLFLLTGSTLQATDVALCLGNEMAQIHRHLNGTPLYFGSPWPNEQLLSIPRTGSVAILGSRLTAVDEALYLVDHGHQGPIFFLSRSGTLPKVQAVNSKKPQLAYKIWNVAREVEQTPAGAIMTIFSRLNEEMVRHNGGKSVFGHYQPDQDVVSMFRNDVEMARSGHIPGQAVLQQTAPVLERYWNCMSEAEQGTFCKEYMTLLTAHRNAMPLRTGERLLGLLESGQLRVLPLNTKLPIKWEDGTFTIPVASLDGIIHTNALIESTGIEGNPTHIQAPLMRNLVARQIVRAHAAGGVECDYQTLRVAKGAYIIGSMTRGKHFYSTSIDRNVRHAERIADTILGIPLRRPLHVALFVGTDLYSQLQVSKVVQQLMAWGLLPFVFIAPSGIESSCRSREQRELEFFERKLLQSTIMPYLGDSTASAGIMTVQQLQARFPILVETVPDINNRAFIQSLGRNYIDIGFSFNLSHSAGAEIISYFDDRSGILDLAMDMMMPDSISAGSTGKCAYTLRKFGADQAQLSPVARRGFEIDCSKAFLNSLDPVWHLGAESVCEYADAAARGLASQISPSRQQTAMCCSDMIANRFDHVRLVDSNGMKDVLLRAFGTELNSVALRQAIEDAYSAFLASDNNLSISQISVSKLDIRVFEGELVSSETASAASTDSFSDNSEPEIIPESAEAVKAERRSSLRHNVQAQVRSWARSLNT